MSTRKTTLFYGLLIATSSLAVGMVVSSRFGLTPLSSAQTIFTAPPMNSAPVTGMFDAQTFRNIAREQSPIVVSIATSAPGRERDLSDFFGGQVPEEFRRFFEPQPGPQAPRSPQAPGRPAPPVRGGGSGFIISADGLILTNNHVVEDATEIVVSLYGDDDKTYPAKLIGRDELIDSALIQLTEMPTRPLPLAKFGDSAQMAAGDWVMAIGNPFGLNHTVSVGVISAIGRPFEMTPQREAEMLQTDAAINPGNSGGPLLNLRGEVVGMATAIFSNGAIEGNIGIGFAVPINTIRDLLPQLRTGKVTRGRIGVGVNPVTAEDFQEFGLKSRTGALVSQVAPNGAAARGGIEPGDVIIEFSGRPVPNTQELVKMVSATRPGTTVPVKLLRDRREMTVNVTVDELDLEAEQQAQRRAAPPRPDSQLQGSESFGLALSNLTPQRARELELPAGRTGALVAEVDPAGPAARALRAGDVILQVNRTSVSNATEASRLLQQIEAGRLAQLLIWRDGGELFVTVRKE